MSTPMDVDPERRDALIAADLERALKGEYFTDDGDPLTARQRDLVRSSTPADLQAALAHMEAGLRESDTKIQWGKELMALTEPYEQDHLNIPLLQLVAFMPPAAGERVAELLALIADEHGYITIKRPEPRHRHAYAVDGHGVSRCIAADCHAWAPPPRSAPPPEHTTDLDDHDETPDPDPDPAA